MAILNINKNKFEKDIGKFDEKMQTQVAMFGTPVESHTNAEIQVEVFPNRPDLLSYHGFKRAFLAFLGKKTGLKSYTINKPEKDYLVTIDSSVKEVRPFTACAIVKNLNLDDEKIKEIIDMQEKLHLTLGRKRKKAAIGIYPLEEIKLPITFKALEPDQIKFMPLDSERELSGLEILQRHPTGKEYAHLLSGKAKFPVFIDSENKVLSMPPIINSQSTGRIKATTKNVFVECSGFDLETLKTCLNIIVTSLAEMGAKIYQMEVKYGYMKKELTPNLESKTMKISIENANKLLGLDLKEKQIKELIERMGYNYKPGKGKDGIAEIPSWRTDILHEVDLIEDIAIAYGYENFIPEIPAISTTGSPDAKEMVKKNLAAILSGLGMLEVSNYHLTTKTDQIVNMGFQEKNVEFTEVMESKTDYRVLRQNLSHFLMKNLSENVDSEYPQKIFELGTIFSTDAGNIKEKESLSMAVSPGNFTDIRQAAEYLFKMTGQQITFQETEKVPSWFIEGRTAKIVFNGRSIGFLGEVHPKILKNWRVRMPVALLEIEIDSLLDELAK